jgi:Ribosomal protein S3
MGRKINPLIFRSKYKYKKSNWVGDDKTYSGFIKDDYFLRKFIYNFFAKEETEINSIYIFRKQTSIATQQAALYLVIYLSKLKSKKIFEKIVYLKHLLQKNFYNNNANVHLQVLNGKEHQLVINKFNNLAKRMKQQTAVKLLMSNFILSLKKINRILGAKVIVKGRINGSEKARVLKEDFGVINLQKIGSKIGFLTKALTTKDGIVNINFIYNLR